MHSLREELRQQVEILPEDLIQEVADFAAFLLLRRQKTINYQEWNEANWQQFTLQHFFRDTENDVAYSLANAKEIYQ